MSASVRLAVLPDFVAELWPSMDLCAEQLLANWPPGGPAVVRVCPEFRRIAGAVPILRHQRTAFNVDRVLNRFVVFPKYLRRVAASFDLFHVVDHSYAHLIHELPAGRAGAFCYDLDAFRCLVEPAAAPRPRWFRALARRTLTGLQRAAVVFLISRQTGEDLCRYNMVDPAKFVYAPLGVAAEFTPAAGELPPSGRPTILHDGSCIPRKRVDVLLDVVAEVRRAVPEVKLVKVGGTWTADQRERIQRHGLAAHIDHRHDVTRHQLADLYRAAGVVLVPSDYEGFGLPVIEGLACGAPVVASDLPVLREAGGPAAVYAPVADVPAWAECVKRIFADPEFAPPRAARLAWASRFTWSAHAETVATAYRQLLGS